MKAVSGQTVRGFINFQSFNYYNFKYGGKKPSKTSVCRMNLKY